MELIAVALGPSLFWLFYFWRQDRSTHEGAGPMARAFLWGALSTIPAIILELFFNRPGVTANALECFLVIGPAEELCKMLATMRAIRNEPDFDEPSDGIVAASAVALGFAFAENLGYFSEGGAPRVLIRSLLSVPGHVLFAVFYGAALGRRKCDPQLPASTILTAFLTASFLHGLFDALLFHAAYMPLVMLLGFLWLVRFQWSQYRKLAAECAAEGKALHAASSGVQFVESSPAAPPVAEQAPPVAEPAPPPGFSVRAAASAYFWGLVMFFGLGIGWHVVTPVSQHNTRSDQMVIVCVLGLILGGLISAYRSPGRTIRESAAGLAALGMTIGLLGTANPVGAAIFAVFLGFLGAFGGWLGEAISGSAGAGSRSSS